MKVLVSSVRKAEPEEAESLDSRPLPGSGFTGTSLDLNSMLGSLSSNFRFFNLFTRQSEGRREHEKRGKKDHEFRVRQLGRRPTL